MRNTKRAPERKRGAKAVPVLGAAGLLSLAGGASAATGGYPWRTCPRKRPRKITNSFSARKSFLTLACQRSMSSTKRAPNLSLAIRSPSVDAAVVGAAAVVAVAAAVAAVVVAGEVAVVVAAAAAAAASHGDVAASAKEHTSFKSRTQ